MIYGLLHAIKMAFQIMPICKSLYKHPLSYNGEHSIIHSPIFLFHDYFFFF